MSVEGSWDAPVAQTGLVDDADVFAETWARLVAAAEERNHPMRLCAVANVAESDNPECRILVLRGASRELGCLWFHTDRRSPKVAQFQCRPQTSIVMYDNRDGVQFRIKGETTIRTDDAIADQHWQQIAVASRYVYAMMAAPGTLLPAHDPQLARHQRQLDHEDAIKGRENFAVLEVSIQSIEWQQISGAGDRRALMTRNDDWEVRPVVP